MNTILGTKLGMTQVFDDQARAIPVTVIKAGPCHVVQVKTIEKDGYSAVQISFGEAKQGAVNQPTAGHFAKAGVAPARHLIEVRVDDVSGYEVGQVIKIADVLE
jgi:large subunit ribosomal protein L3